MKTQGQGRAPRSSFYGATSRVALSLLLITAFCVLGDSAAWAAPKKKQERPPNPLERVGDFFYRIARKHAGSQDGGWQFTMRQLYEKSGSASRFQQCDRAKEMQMNTRFAAPVATVAIGLMMLGACSEDGATTRQAQRDRSSGQSP